VVQAQPRLARLAQLRPGRHHLGDGERGAEAPRKPPEGTIRDPRHRGDEQSAAQSVRADSHEPWRPSEKREVTDFIRIARGKKSRAARLLFFHGSADGP
jgi:hypothetical protein